MTITTTAKQIARKSTLTITNTTTQNNNKVQHQHPRSPFRDPYNDDEEKYDCVDCWAYNKSRFKQWCWWVAENSKNYTNNGGGNSSGHRRRQARRTSIP